MEQNKQGGKLYLKFEKLKASRSLWESHWDEVAKYIIPRKDNAYGQSVAGEKKNMYLYDSTSVYANETLASALHGMLTNPTSPWFSLSSGDRTIDANDEVREWIKKTSTKITQVLNNSNFQPEMHEVYLDLCSFGTCFYRIEEDEDFVVRFESRPIYEACVAQNHRGLIDTAYYEYEETIENIVERFGIEAIAGDTELERLMESDPLAKQTILHATEPRRVNASKSKTVPKNMPFASYHILKKNKRIIKESGFHENPNIVARWSKNSGEVYGRSPGMKALSDIRMLNKMKKATIEAAQLAVAPPLQVPDDGVLLPIRMTPNSVNYFRAGTKDRIEPINFGNNITLSESQMNAVRQQILQDYFIDQLHLVENDRMTATEVNQRKEEQLRLLGPVLGRLNFELLRPMIERVFNIMKRKKLIDPAPATIGEKGLEIKYVSQIARAQLTIEAENLARSLQMVAPFAESNPEVFDNYDVDAIVDYSAEIFGLPSEIFRKDTEVDELRQGRQEANQKLEQQQDQSHQADLEQKQGV